MDIERCNLHILLKKKILPIAIYTPNAIQAEPHCDVVPCEPTTKEDFVVSDFFQVDGVKAE